MTKLTPENLAIIEGGEIVPFDLGAISSMHDFVNVRWQLGPLPVLPNQISIGLYKDGSRLYQPKGELELGPYFLLASCPSYQIVKHLGTQMEDIV